MLPDSSAPDQDFVLLPFYTVKDGHVVHEPHTTKWGTCPPAHLLAEYLKRFTLWPVHPSWADALWDATFGKSAGSLWHEGREKVIQGLTTVETNKDKFLDPGEKITCTGVYPIQQADGVCDSKEPRSSEGRP